MERRTLFIFAAIVLALVLVVLAREYILGGVATLLDEARHEDADLTLSAPNIAPAENAALRVEEAAADVDLSEEQHALAVEAPYEELNSAEARLMVRKNEAPLRAFDAVADLLLVGELPRESLLADPAPWEARLSQLRALYGLAAARVQAALDEEAPDEALTLALGLAETGRFMASGAGSTGTWRIHAEGYGKGLYGIKLALDAGAGDAEALLDLREAVEGLTLPPDSLAQALQGDYSLIAALLEQDASELAAQLKALAQAGGLSQERLESLLAARRRYQPNRTQGAVADYFRRLLSQVAQPCQRMQAEALTPPPLVESPVNLSYFGRAVAAIFLPDGQELMQLKCLAQTRRALLEAYVAMAMYVRDQEELPPEIDVLAPQYLPLAIPKDGFTGQGILFQAEGEPVIYSPGPDYEDDGGTAEEPFALGEDVILPVGLQVKTHFT